MSAIALGELITCSKGFQVPRDETDVDKEIPYLHYGDLYKKYDFRLNLNEKMDEIIKIDQSSKIKKDQYLEDGDIVFALTSETVDDLGHCTLIFNPDGLPFVSGMETTVVHVKDKGVVNPSYLNYYFHSKGFQKRLRQYVTGMKVYRVHPDDMKEIEIELPDIKIQKSIVNFLDAISDRIKTNGAINDNLLQCLRSLYHHYFNEQSVGIIQIGEVSKIYSGGTPNTSEASYWNGGINWLSSGETRNQFILNTEKKISNEGVSNSSTKKAFCFDTVIASAGQGLTRGQTSMLLTDTYINQSVIVVHPDERYRIAIYCNLGERYDELRNLSDSSSIRGSITTGIVSDLEMPLCSSDDLDMFNKESTAIVKLIKSNMEQIERFVSLRDYLLPKLMSGEIDVSTLEIPN